MTTLIAACGCRSIMDYYFSKLSKNLWKFSDIVAEIKKDRGGWGIGAATGVVGIPAVNEPFRQTKRTTSRHCPLKPFCSTATSLSYQNGLGDIACCNIPQ